MTADGPGDGGDELADTGSLDGAAAVADDRTPPEHGRSHGDALGGASS